MLNPVRLPHRVRSFISTSFHHFGIHCASHPIRVILISAVVITSLFYPALALYSNSHPHVLSSIFSLFDAPSYRSDLRDIWQGHDALHVSDDSVTRTRCGLERTLRVERILVPSVDDAPAGAAAPSTFRFAFDLENAVHDRLQLANPRISCLPDVQKGHCFILAPSTLFNKGIPATSHDILRVINHSRNFSLADIPMDMSMLFSARFSSDDQPGVIDHAHQQWLSLVHKAVSEMSEKISITPFVFEKSRFLSLQYNSRPSQISIVSVFLYLSYLGIFLSFSGSLRRMDTVHSRFGLTFTGLIEIIASTIASVSVFALGGFRITMVPWGILPLIIVFVGAENMFQLVDAVTSTSVSLSVKERIGTGLAVAGTTNTLNTVAYNTILGVIAFFSSGAIRQFCSFAIVLLVAHWFLVHTFFIAVLSIDLQRLELSDMLSQDKSKKVESKGPQSIDPNQEKTMNRIQQRLRVVPSKNGSLVLMLAVTLVLYYVTYPFPSRSKSQPDPVSFLQRARRPPVQSEESPSPAFRLWNMLNPENDPLVHIHIETPIIVAPNPDKSSDVGQDSRRQDPRNYNTSIKQLVTWLFKILILPMGTTIGLLYLLLRYLLKGTDALEAYRTEPDVGSDDSQTPQRSPVESSIRFSTLPRAFATDIELIAGNHDMSIIALVSVANEVIIWNDGYHRLNVDDVLYAASSSSEATVAISSIALDHKGRYCAIGTSSGTVAIWNIPSQRLSLDRVPHLMMSTLSDTITDLGFINTACKKKVEPSSQLDCRVVATCGDGGVFEINLYNTNVQSIPSSHPETILRSSLLRNHRSGSIYVAFLYDDGIVEVLSYEGTWNSTCLIHPTNFASQLYLSHVQVREDKLMVIAVATQTGAISLWNASTGELLHVLDTSFGDITQIRLGNYATQTCKHCGEITPDAFVLAFSVGETVYVYRCSMPPLSRHCACPIASRLTTKDSFGYRSRSSSTASASCSPKRKRQRLPSLFLGPNVAEFPVSAHGVHSRKVSSDRELNRRLSELPISHEEDRDNLTVSRASQGQSAESSFIVEFVIDISYERGGWDMVDGRWLCGVRRRSRTPSSVPPLLRAASISSHLNGLTANVLDRWEMWTYDSSIMTSNFRASSLLSLSPSPLTKTIIKNNTEYPRLPFTRVFPVIIRSTACVAGFGNTAGIADLAQSL